MPYYKNSWIYNVSDMDLRQETCKKFKLNSCHHHPLRSAAQPESRRQVGRKGLYGDAQASAGAAWACVAGAAGASVTGTHPSVHLPGARSARRGHVAPRAPASQGKPVRPPLAR